MAIDLDNILSTFVGVAQDTIGNQLSSTGPPTALEPSVIIVRQDAPKPEMPYVTVDVLNITDRGNWLLASYVKDTGELIYESTKQILIQYTVYGGNAIQIANDLHGYFRVNSILSRIETETGGNVLTVDDVTPLPTLIADTFMEVASININFGIVDTLIIPDDGTNYFDKVSLEGEVEGNSGTLSISVDAP